MESEPGKVILVWRAKKRGGGANLKKALESDKEEEARSFTWLQDAAGENESDRTAGWKNIKARLLGN